MSFDADLNACAALVERADPWRFRAVMAAPVSARRVLFPLYAFNVEVARAPWVTQEPMIAEMRLQWWRDVCEEIGSGGPVRRHEVATPLAGILSEDKTTLLDELAAARRWDIYKDAFEDQAHFDRYIDQTSGHLAWIAASLLGEADESVVRDAAYAAGIAAWFRAIPALVDRGRIPMIDGTSEGVVSLAKSAIAKLQNARSHRAKISKEARPALLHIGPAETILKAALQHPEAVIEGRLPDPVESDRFGLGYRALTGRW